jgi:hypothetical protein
MFLEIQSLSNTARALLLARIANVLTVCARDTYEAGTENVLEPQILRAYNELLHRVTGAATGHLLGSKGYSLEDILEMMRYFGEKHNRVNAIKWAIEFASYKPLP